MPWSAAVCVMPAVRSDNIHSTYFFIFAKQRCWPSQQTTVQCIGLECADKYVNLDDGWAIGRNANGTFKHDPELFPHGIKPVADYVHSKGMLFGIYTARGSSTCMGRPGSVRRNFLHDSSN